LKHLAKKTTVVKVVQNGEYPIGLEEQVFEKRRQ
jgi:hypothetical protein